MNADYQTITVHVDESPHLLSRVRLAATWATKFGAHLIGVAATGLPTALYFGGRPARDEAMIPQYANLLKDSAETALAIFEAAADKIGARSFESRVIEKEPGIALAVQSHFSDITVISQDEPDEGTFILPTTFSDSVILNAVNTVLIAPAVKEFPMSSRRVMVAWDGSAEASRAVHAAIPILKQANAVEVTVFDGTATRQGGGAAVDLATYLARHDIKVDVSNPTGQNDIGDAILAHAYLIDADLLVMGAYGHTRFREFLTGGATRTVLQSATIPVLTAR